MQGLTDEQIEDLKLHDEWEDKCKPSGGAIFNQDKIGRRNGHGNSLSLVRYSSFYDSMFLPSVS